MRSRMREERECVESVCGDGKRWRVREGEDEKDVSECGESVWKFLRGEKKDQKRKRGDFR